jgi:glucose/arabinose dehydrogenase
MVRLVRRPILILSAAALFSSASPAQAFRVDTLVRGTTALFPVTLSFLPGNPGAFIFGERTTGRIMMYDNGLKPDPLLTIPVEGDDGQGLLGLAVHPLFPDSPFVTVYSVRLRDRASVLERYELHHGVWEGPRLLLFVPRRDEQVNHNGGQLGYGPDGKLYLAVGDHGARPDNAQDTLGGRNPRGKILRMNSDGTVPADNLLPRRLFWALGLRCPGGIVVDEQSGKVYVTEGGADGANALWEVPRGANLGWPNRQRTALPGGSLPKMLYRFPEGEQPELTGVAIYHGDAFPGLRGAFLLTGSRDPTLWAGERIGAGDSLSLKPLFRSNTGLSDVKVGSDGSIYVVVGPYLGSRIFRFTPVEPKLSGPSYAHAMQGLEFRYLPSCEGTPPEYLLRSGPAGMKVDRQTGEVRWVPSSQQARAGRAEFDLVARNGAGESSVICSVKVENVNDPPGLPKPLLPADNEELRTSGAGLEMLFRWVTADDPDGDSLQYRLELDTTSSFTSPIRTVAPAGHSDSVVVSLPPVSRTWYWRVLAFDGELSSRGDAPVMRLAVVVPRILARERLPQSEPVLEQNYPNPFNPNTSIRYTLAQAGRVRLAVFNLIGQEVVRLVDGIQPEGAHEVGFANIGLPNGIYFYRLAAPGHAETKKIVITR